MFTVPGSRVVHPQGWDDSDRLKLWQQPLSWREYYSFRNYIYTCRRHGRPGPVFYGRLLGHVLLDIGITLLFRHSKSRSIKIIFWRTLDGLRGKLGKNIDFLPD